MWRRAAVTQLLCDGDLVWLVVSFLVALISLTLKTGLLVVLCRNVTEKGTIKDKNAICTLPILAYLCLYCYFS